MKFRKSVLGLLLGLSGCAFFEPAKSAVPNHDEAACIAKVVAASDLRMAACGKNVEGPCSTDSLMDLEESERVKCIEKN